MAKKQTRRSVSLNRSVYEAAKLEADRRGQTLAAFVETALAAAGVPIVEHPRQPLAQVQARHAARGGARLNSAKPSRLPSRERQMLGDGAANALGYR